MKIRLKDRKKINDFIRKFLDRRYRIDWNTFHFDGTSKEHRDMIFKICCYLYENKFPFLTRPLFKGGYCPDIVCPTFYKPIIEVRASETTKRTIEKLARIPPELYSKIIYVEANQEFEPELLY